MNKIAMLTIGNGGGYWFDDASKKASWWRTPRAAQTIVNSIVQSGQTLSVKCMRNILENRYYNLNYSMENPVDLAEYKKMDELKRFAYEKPLNHVAAWLRGYFI